MILMAFRFHWEFGYLSRHFDERYPFTCMKAFLNIEYFFESTVFHVFFNSTVFHVFRGNLQHVWTMTILYHWQYLKKRVY